ncbi:hypothetical protein COOONC_19087 [Cooperia oncophora]
MTYIETVFLQRLDVLKYSIVPRSRNCRGLHYFVIVHVRAADKLIREQWRRTYGQLQREHNFTIIFATGLAPNKSLNDDLMDEAFLHGDLLQANFSDTYRNLTLKVRLSLIFFVLRHSVQIIPRSTSMYVRSGTKPQK